MRVARKHKRLRLKRLKGDGVGNISPIISFKSCRRKASFWRGGHRRTHVFLPSSSLRDPSLSELKGGNMKRNYEAKRKCFKEPDLQNFLCKSTFTQAQEAFY